MAFGLLDTQFIDFAETMTESRLKAIKNRLGISMVEFVNRVEGAMSALATKDSVTREFTYDTTDDSFKYRGPTDKIWQRGAEYTVARPQRGMGRRGHMIPIYHYEIALGVTDRYLQEADADQFEDEVRATIQAVARGRIADVWSRFWSADVWPLDDDGIGTTPGFAGSGTGADAFFGTTLDGHMTDEDYTHYFFADSLDATAIQAQLDKMIENMGLWYKGTLDILPTPQMLDIISQWRADDIFVPTGSMLIRPAERETQTLVDASRYAGVYKGKVRVRHAIEQGVEGVNLAVIRPDTKPLAWRYDPIYGREAYLKDRGIYPLTQADILQVYGIGVAERTAAAFLSAGEGQTGYTAPTIIR